MANAPDFATSLVSQTIVQKCLSEQDERIQTMGTLMTTESGKQLYRFVLDSIPLAMVAMDYDSKITSFNKQAEKLTGYSTDEAVGRPCYEILNSSRCEYDCPLHAVQRVREPSSGLEAEIINRHGEHIPVRIGAASLLNEDNHFTDYLEVIEDVSREKRIQREKNNFLSMIVHDMKSPLIGISGLLKRLKKEKICKTNEKLWEYLRVMDESEARLEATVQEFLEYSRLESGQIKLELGQTDLNNVLQRVIDMHRIRAEDQDIILSYDGKPLTAFEADKKHLQRVFTNIIDNAIKYSSSHSEVTINTRETDEEIIIDFQDQGRGIVPDEIPYIFDAFYRSESEGEVGGHGLGLPAANTIIRQHGGRISVESMPGKGSVFTVRLPKH
jgi:PAS domain S-box-containing protein